jgi:sugar phosphate isomerase/epimerase
MIKLSYSTFGLTNLDFLTAIDEVEKAGYPGIEISFHRDQFNPFDLSDDDLAAVKKRLDSGRVKAACVATASHFFTPQRPHEPSLMTPDLAGRKRRIELVKRGIHVARKLGVNLVTFGSGFIRDEHVSNPAVNPRELLIDSIQQCIAEIRPDEDITLLIEPEPGMFIETMEQGLSLMHEIDSPRFRLHIDLLHSYCSEQNYVEALAQAAPHIRYLHVSDAQQGYNLKIVKDAPGLSFDLDFASYLVYFPETADYALLDRHFPRYFCDLPPGPAQRKRLDSLLAQAGIQKSPEIVHYPGLYAGASAFDDEFFTYLDLRPRPELRRARTRQTHPRLPARSQRPATGRQAHRQHPDRHRPLPRNPRRRHLRLRRQLQSPDRQRIRRLRLGRALPPRRIVAKGPRR